MAKRPTEKPTPLVSFVVDEATEFTLKAEGNPKATVKQPASQGELDRRILTVEVDEVTEFTLKAIPASAEGSEANPVGSDVRGDAGKP